MKKEVVAHAAENGACHEFMHAETIIREAAALGSPPHVCVRLYEQIHSEDADIHTIAKTISTDPNLVARLLKIVNGLASTGDSEISTISDALQVFDTESMYNLVIGIAATRANISPGSHFYTVDDYWQHSVFVGLCCKHLAQICRMADVDTFFIAGLLHDIGLPIMYSTRPQTLALQLKRSKGNEMLLAANEREQFGFDHGEIGGALLKSWQLPEKLITAITHHHQAHDQPASAILHLAELISNAINLEQVPCNFIEQYAQYNVWAVLEIEKDTLDLLELVRTVNNEKTALLGTLFDN